MYIYLISFEISNIVAVVKISEDDFESGVTANIRIEQNSPDDVITITGTIKGLENSSKHGLHIHEAPYTDNDCLTAGTHFNPKAAEHGAPGSILGTKKTFTLQKNTFKKSTNNIYLSHFINI